MTLPARTCQRAGRIRPALSHMPKSRSSARSSGGYGAALPARQAAKVCGHKRRPAPVNTRRSRRAAGCRLALTVAGLPGEHAGRGSCAIAPGGVCAGMEGQGNVPPRRRRYRRGACCTRAAIHINKSRPPLQATCSGLRPLSLVKQIAGFHAPRPARSASPSPRTPQHRHEQPHARAYHHDRQQHAHGHGRPQRAHEGDRAQYARV